MAEKQKKVAATKIKTKTEVEKVPAKKEVTVTTPMKKKPHPWVYVVLGGVLVLILLMVFFRRNIVVATVNGKPIFWFHYVASLEQQGGNEVLEQMILEKLISEEAGRQNVTVGNEVVEAEIEKIKGNLEAQNMTIEDALSQQGMSLSQLQQQIMMRQIVSQLATKDVVVSDQEVTDYLEKNKDSIPTGKDAPTNVNELIKNQLLQTKQQEAIKTFLDNLKTQANIQYW